MFDNLIEVLASDDRRKHRSGKEEQMAALVASKIEKKYSHGGTSSDASDGKKAKSKHLNDRKSSKKGKEKTIY